MIIFWVDLSLLGRAHRIFRLQEMNPDAVVVQPEKEGHRALAAEKDEEDNRYFG